jgi:hypothetical protein
MLTRRVALPVAALTALATLPVLTGAPAGASVSAGKPVVPASRGRQQPGNPRGPQRGPQKNNEPQPQNNCPTRLWTIPLEVKGLACLLLLPKPEPPDQNGQNGDNGSSGGGLGSLLG